MPDWSRASGRIVYVSDRAGGAGPGLWLTDPSGADLGRLAEGPGRDVEPRWSPDGRSIAFASDRTGAFQVWLLEGVGRALRQVTTDPAGDAHAPDFVPDGGALLYAAEHDGRRSLWRIAVAGGMPVPLTTDDVPGSWDARPRVSPDGMRVVFTRSRRGDADLWMLDLATGEARPIIENPLGADDAADWSPDGRRLVYQTGGATDLYQADVRPLLRP
jgi:Tol biopolymer transport system component